MSEAYDTIRQHSDAIHQSTANSITLIIDNSEAMCVAADEVARTAVRDDMGTGVGRDEYEAMLRGRGHSGTERYEYARVVGIAVRDWLQETIAGALDDANIGEGHFLRLLLIDLLDLGSSSLAELIGDHYLPESADDIDWRQHTS